MQEQDFNHEKYEKIDCGIYRKSIGDGGQIFTQDIGNVQLADDTINSYGIKDAPTSVWGHEEEFLIPGYSMVQY